MSINNLYRYKNKHIMSLPIWVVIFVSIFLLFKNNDFISNFQSKTRIDVYQNSEECKDSFHSDIQSYVCYELEKRALEISKTMAWPKETQVSCEKHFFSCFKNKFRKTSPEMSSFGVIVRKGEYISFPIFLLKNDYAIISGNGYPFKFGSNSVPEINIDPNKLFKKGTSLSDDVCKTSNGSITCSSRIELIRSKSSESLKMLFYSN